MIVLHVFVAATVKLQEFVIKKPIFFTIRTGYQVTAPVEISMFVPVTHYDVRVTSRLAKMFNQLPHFVQMF